MSTTICQVDCLWWLFFIYNSVYCLDVDIQVLARGTPGFSGLLKLQQCLILILYIEPLFPMLAQFLVLAKLDIALHKEIESKTHLVHSFKLLVV